MPLTILIAVDVDTVNRFPLIANYPRISAAE